MKEIKLTRGLVALVDNEDYERVNQFKWQAMPVRGGYYAKRHVVMPDGKQVFIPMHRFIMLFPKDIEIDHIDHNTLNNQKYNLRICTFHQNRMNRKLNKNNKTGYKGVFISKRIVRDKTYSYIQAYIKVNNKSIYLGHYDTVENAAMAYDNAAVKYFGEFANLNFQKI